MLSLRGQLTDKRTDLTSHLTGEVGAPGRALTISSGASSRARRLSVEGVLRFVTVLHCPAVPIPERPTLGRQCESSHSVPVDLRQPNSTIEPSSDSPRPAFHAFHLGHYAGGCNLGELASSVFGEPEIGIRTG